MSELKKINEQELENVAGGAAATGTWKIVSNLPGGYLAIRTAPAAQYENEINHIGLKVGDQVQITGAYVQGTGFDGRAATYVWVYAPKFECSGYVNAYYLK